MYQHFTKLLLAGVVAAVGHSSVAMAGDVAGHDTCEVGGGADDIYNLAAIFDDNGNSDPTDDEIVVEMRLCDDPTGTRTKYRVHFDHTPPLFSVDGTTEDRNGDSNIDEDDFCATTSDDTMMRRRNKDTGPGIIEFVEDAGMFFLIYTVLVDDLNPSLLLDDTVYIWADTQLKGIIDRAPDTDALSDDCAKPEVETEVVALTLLAAKTVFVTSSRFNGDLFTAAVNLGLAPSDGLDAGDKICQKLADNAILAGTYRAWLSDSTGSPSTRFVQATVPYVRTDGVVVADDYAALIGCTAGCLKAAISILETGVAAIETRDAWTATTTGGTLLPSPFHFEHCSDWSTSSTAWNGGVGDEFKNSTDWTREVFHACNMTSRLYCFEQ